MNLNLPHFPRRGLVVALFLLTFAPLPAALVVEFPRRAQK